MNINDKNCTRKKVILEAINSVVMLVAALMSLIAVSLLPVVQDAILESFGYRSLVLAGILIAILSLSVILLAARSISEFMTSFRKFKKARQDWKSILG